MTKFEKAVKTLTEVNSVAERIAYSIKDINENIAEIEERLAEYRKEADDHRYDIQWAEESLADYQVRLGVWEELLTYLEKKYLK